MLSSIRTRRTEIVTVFVAFCLEKTVQMNLLNLVSRTLCNKIGNTILCFLPKGLAFRKGTNQLFSASMDRSVKVWNLDEMTYIETL